MREKRLKNTEWIVGIISLVLLAIGLVALYSATQSTELNEFKKQIQWFLISIPFIIAVYIIDYRLIVKLSPAIYIVFIILLVGVLFTDPISGASSWYQIGDFLSFQPSEMVKILMIIFYAGILVKNRDELSKYSKGFLKHICLLAPIIGLLLLEPHFSASVVIIGICAIMMIMAGCKFWHFLVTGVVAGIPALAFLIIKEPYRLQRVITFLDPWQDATDTGWQVIQSLYAIGSGGLFGAGLGESKQKFLYIPEPHNDFIFSILGEELGFIGCAVVLILFAIFIWRGVLIAMRAPDMFGSLVAIGITALVAIQVIINVAVVTSSMPATGMPLPFFSYRWNSIVHIIV